MKEIQQIVQFHTSLLSVLSFSHSVNMFTSPGCDTRWPVRRADLESLRVMSQCSDHKTTATIIQVNLYCSICIYAAGWRAGTYFTGQTCLPSAFFDWDKKRPSLLMAVLLLLHCFCMRLKISLQDTLYRQVSTRHNLVRWILGALPPMSWGKDKKQSQMWWVGITLKKEGLILLRKGPFYVIMSALFSKRGKNYIEKITVCLWAEINRIESPSYVPSIQQL